MRKKKTTKITPKLCGGCKLAMKDPDRADEIIHDEGCPLYNPEPKHLPSELIKLAREFEKQAGKYFTLAAEEKDPLGHKFYESSAMALC